MSTLGWTIYVLGWLFGPISLIVTAVWFFRLSPAQRDAAAQPVWRTLTQIVGVVAVIACTIKLVV